MNRGQTTAMLENQELEPQILGIMVPGDGFDALPGTIQDLTFNLFSILADNHLLANALFWITVWITDKAHGPWTMDRGYWSCFCVRFG